jgi:NAD(P)-dependent dehydrogenase (short-subunit alcohol dehydrogenase family)
MSGKKTAIITGASGGIGAGLVDAVLYLVQAGHVSGEILHVDGAAPARHW